VKYPPLACKLAHHVAHASIVRSIAVQVQIHVSPHVAAFAQVTSAGGVSIPFHVPHITSIESIHDTVSVPVAHEF